MSSRGHTPAMTAATLAPPAPAQPPALQRQPRRLRRSGLLRSCTPFRSARHAATPARTHVPAAQPPSARRRRQQRRACSTRRAFGLQMDIEGRRRRGPPGPPLGDRRPRPVARSTSSTTLRRSSPHGVHQAARVDDPNRAAERGPVAGHRRGAPAPGEPGSSPRVRPRSACAAGTMRAVASAAPGPVRPGQLDGKGGRGPAWTSRGVHTTRPRDNPASGNCAGWSAPTALAPAGGEALRRRPRRQLRHVGRAQAQSPMEFIEAEVPARVERYAIRPDSGGPGSHRGGVGTVREYWVLAEDLGPRHAHGQLLGAAVGGTAARRDGRGTSCSIRRTPEERVVPGCHVVMLRLRLPPAVVPHVACAHGSAPARAVRRSTTLLMAS